MTAQNNMQLVVQPDAVDSLLRCTI